MQKDTNFCLAPDYTEAPESSPGEFLVRRRPRSTVPVNPTKLNPKWYYILYYKICRQETQAREAGTIVVIEPGIRLSGRAREKYGCRREQLPLRGRFYGRLASRGRMSYSRATVTRRTTRCLQETVPKQAFNVGTPPLLAPTPQH